eukprot:scaffold2448_cov119-Isochrysis_galbana.AAC.12
MHANKHLDTVQAEMTPKHSAQFCVSGKRLRMQLVTQPAVPRHGSEHEFMFERKPSTPSSEQISTSPSPSHAPDWRRRPLARGCGPRAAAADALASGWTGTRAAATDASLPRFKSACRAWVQRKTREDGQNWILSDISRGARRSALGVEVALGAATTPHPGQRTATSSPTPQMAESSRPIPARHVAGLSLARLAAAFRWCLTCGRP